MLRILKKIFFAAALISGCFFLASCENDEKQVRALTGQVQMKEEGRDIESYLSQDGKMRARLRAPYMVRVFSDTLYVEFPRSLHVDFFDANNRVETYLDSRYGKYMENLNKVYLRDSVVVISAKGDTLRSPDLWWDQNTRMFYTDKYAEYRARDKSIYGGKGLEATQDLSSITFKYPTGTVQVPESGFPK
ncbi:MAG TPA: LPS export ABC transporter periplasmic protein LptC [Chitinophagaceae bacterium]|nr:LPS export ABC transporter periplasmic protein LptC [Chitinophagaceae bacterium]